jgi:hypothetical protein
MSTKIETKEPLVPKECFSKECRIRSAFLTETTKRENLEKQMNLVRSENETYKEAIVELFGIINDLFVFLKGRLKQRIESGQSLTFGDIHEINRLSRHLPSPDTLTEIFDLVEKYLTDLKSKFDIDCIEELYRYENLLPLKYHTSRPRSRDTVGLIQEKIKAIVLYEYRKLIRIEGLKFIEGKIDYAEYMRKIEEYTKNADESYPK